MTIGITSFGGYIPRLRIDRMTIYQRTGWFAPATVMIAQGQRSFCNWDEDSLTMAVAAARDCLAGVDRARIDGLMLCSTTLPFADRLNAAIVQTALNLRDDVDTRDITATQRAATSGLITALDTVKAQQAGQVLVVGSDRRQARSAYFYEMWFGDGAAAVTVGTEGVIAEYLGSYSVSYDFVDHYRGAGKRFDYMWEERWVRDQGYSRFIPEAVEGLLSRTGLTADDVDHLVFPCFFKAEHRKIAARLGVAPDRVVDNLHEVCGETGAAHPLVMLAHALEGASPGDGVLLCGFGAGCDALFFRVTEAIADLPPRTGVRGSLERATTTDNYEKFIRFRELWDTEMGIRAEAPTQTAMTTLWRKRKMLLGLVGGECSACGTRQWPRTDICVNPACRAVGTQVDAEFADTPARVKTFTGDLLAVSIDPPAVYGMVQFEGGGRMLADFSDCAYEDVWVGQPVTMALRRRVEDAERGFTGYFYKAIPDLTVPRPRKGAPLPGQELRFDGRVAIVTGAGAGLGRAYALELARRGARVVVNDLGGPRDGRGAGSGGPADEVVREIRDAGGEAVASHDSVATVEGGQAIVDAAVAAFGRVDILINNAGILRDRTLVKMEPEDWEAVLAVHLDAAYNVTRPAFALMKEQGYGRVVMTTSAAGLFGNFGQSNYAAAKMGVVGFALTLASEGRKAGVKVNVVAPIATTRLTEDILPPDVQERLGPEHVVPLTLAFCAEGCDVTGHVVNAGAGFFSRAAIVSAPPVAVGEGAAPTPEEIAARFDEIDDLSAAREYPDAMAQLGPMLGALQEDGGGAPDAAAGDGDGALTAAAVFRRMPEAFQADRAEGVEVVFQFRLSGEGGGEWVSAIADGACTVTEGTHDRPTTTILMEAGDFLEMIGGRLDPMTAFTTGRLRIEGDIMKSQLIEKLFRF